MAVTLKQGDKVEVLRFNSDNLPVPVYRGVLENTFLSFLGDRESFTHFSLRNAELFDGEEWGPAGSLVHVPYDGCIINMR